MPTHTGSNCGQILAPDEDGQRLVCPECGATTSTVQHELVAEVKSFSGLRGIAYACRSKSKWFVKLISEPVWQYTLKIWAHRFKMEDKKNDRYVEHVVNSQTGEVLHSCDEKLTQHQGHGSAKVSSGGKRTRKEV